MSISEQFSMWNISYNNLLAPPFIHISIMVKSILVSVLIFQSVYQIIPQNLQLSFLYIQEIKCFKKQTYRFISSSPRRKEGGNFIHKQILLFFNWQREENTRNTPPKKSPPEYNVVKITSAIVPNNNIPPTYLKTRGK